MPDLERVYSTQLLRAGCCVLHAHRTSAVLCMVSSPELPASGPACAVDAVATESWPWTSCSPSGLGLSCFVLSGPWVAQVQSSHNNSHRHQTRVRLWEHSSRGKGAVWARR